MDGRRILGWGSGFIGNFRDVQLETLDNDGEAAGLGLAGLGLRWTVIRETDSIDVPHVATLTKVDPSY